MGESRQMKEARRRLAGIAKQVDAEKRKNFRYPLWRLLVGLVLPRVKTDYRETWEKRQRDVIARSTKASAHIITQKAKVLSGGSVKKMMGDMAKARTSAKTRTSANKKAVKI
jgi:hypothetical protein